LSRLTYSFIRRIAPNAKAHPGIELPFRDIYRPTPANGHNRSMIALKMSRREGRPRRN
jgi:hypothetical protein